MQWGWGRKGAERRLGRKVVKLEGARLEVRKLSEPDCDRYDAYASEEDSGGTLILLDNLSYCFEKGERVVKFWPQRC